MSSWKKNEGKMPVLGSVPVEVKTCLEPVSRGVAEEFTWDLDVPTAVQEWRVADPTDTEMLDWLADMENDTVNVMLPNECVLANVRSMRDAIKMAMGFES